MVDAHLAHGLADAMRSALARAELAAGRIERDAATPRARRLAVSVSSAVAELDRLLSQLTGLLAREQTPARRTPLAAVVAALRERHAAVLAARGFEWEAASQSATPVLGDAQLARRAGALLLRMAAGYAPGGGRLALDIGGEDASWWIAIHVVARAAPVDPPSTALAELQALASRAGGRCEREHAGHEWRLRLRFPPGAPACRAS